MELSDANNDINQTNKALDDVGLILRRINRLSSFSPPVSSDFYTPSAEMQKYQTMVTVSIGLAGGFLLEKTLYGL